MPSAIKVVIHTIFYRPELVGIGPYTAQLAEWLAQKGHEVHVVSPPPYYPCWKVEKPYRTWKYGVETLAGVHVTRCPIWVPRKPLPAGRALSAISFFLSSFPALVRKMLLRPRIVLAIEPSFLTAIASLFAARCFGALCWLHVQDFELDIAFCFAPSRCRWLQRPLRKLESWLLNKFDVVSTISGRMVTRLAAKGVPQSRRRLLPNWVDTDEIYPLKRRSLLRPELNIPDENVVALFSGSMGSKQGVELLIEAAGLLRNHPNLTFVIAGDGVAAASVRAMAADLSNVKFLPLQPPERLNELLNLADVHMLPQKPFVSDLVMPSKLLGMIASGRPVVATVSEDTEVAAVVSTCGVRVPPEDPASLARAVLMLAENQPLRQRLGRKGREFAVANCDRQRILGDLETSLRSVARISDSPSKKNQHSAVR